MLDLERRVVEHARHAQERRKHAQSEQPVERRNTCDPPQHEVAETQVLPMADVDHGETADDEEHVRPSRAESRRLDVRCVGEPPKLQICVIEHDERCCHAP
jgi:hypothetical protein